jgi:P4 family phage/plasmid primase-like protien
MQSFLKSRETKTDYYNYLSIREKKKYLIEDNDLDTFFELYEKEEKPSIQQRVRPNGHISVRCDIDVKLPLSIEPNGFYNFFDIERIAEIYREVLRKKVKGIQEEQLECYVLEKKEPTVNETHHKKGFHLEFTKLYLHKNDLISIILPSIEQVCKDSNLFSRFSEYMTTIIDSPAVSSNPWCMYGSIKETGEPYLVTKKITSTGEMVQCENPSVKEFLINPTNPKYIKDCIQDISIQKSRLAPLPQEEKKEYIIPKTTGELFSQCKELQPFIGKSMTDFHKWWSCGQALFDITNGSLEGFELWLEISSRAPNFSESGCMTYWNKMKPKEYNIGVLINLAKEDSPDYYERYKYSKSRHVIMESIRRDGQLTSLDCAKAIYLLDNNYLYDPETKCFFLFNGIRWKKIDKEGHELRDKIIDLEVPIMNEIKQMREKVGQLENDKKEKEDDNEDPRDENKQIKELEKKRSLLMKEKLKLKDTTFRRKIIEECKDIFLDREFESKKDQNRFLIGFENGILDLKEGFRQGRKNDYITMSTGYDYKECKNPQVDTYFNQVFVKDEMRYYTLQYLASVLEGGNKQKKMVFWTGEGDNSKSLLEKLCMCTFGDYSGLLPVSYFTAKKQGATTEINRVKKCRIVFINEPSKNDILDVGLLKELTGNDKIQLRKLFNEAEDNTEAVQFKSVVCCNKLPNIQSDDIATWNRIRVIDFESKFVDDNPDETKNEFKKDVDFSFTLEFQQAFMTLLYNLYKQGFDTYEPEQVKSATYKFQARNDEIRNFINLELVDDKGVNTTFTEAWGFFQDFYKKEYPLKRLSISREEFLTEIKLRFKDRLGPNTIKEIRSRTEEDKLKEEKKEEDGDFKHWKLILDKYEPSERFIRQKEFCDEHNIHLQLRRKKFPTWFKGTTYKLVEDAKHSNKLFIQLKKVDGV